MPYPLNAAINALHIVFDVCHYPRRNLQDKFSFLYDFILLKIASSHAKSITSCPRSFRYMSIDSNTVILLLGAGPGSRITTFGTFTWQPVSILEKISVSISLIPKSLLSFYSNCLIIWSNVICHSFVNVDWPNNPLSETTFWFFGMRDNRLHGSSNWNTIRRVACADYCVTS